MIPWLILGSVADVIGSLIREPDPAVARDRIAAREDRRRVRALRRAGHSEMCAQRAVYDDTECTCRASEVPHGR